MRSLLNDRRIARDFALGQYSVLKPARDLYRTQIAVDEATDFSPIQLACMAALCDPSTQSFVACGDFNQRITASGSRSTDDLHWVFRDFDIRPTNVTYRHSRQLNDLARSSTGSTPSLSTRWGNCASGASGEDNKAMLREVNVDKLLLVRGTPRIGPCVGKVGRRR